MNLHFELFIVMLKLCTMITDAATLSDLSLICDYDAIQDSDWISPLCTCVSIRADNTGIMKHIKSIQGNIPLAVFAYEKSYDITYFENCHENGIEIVIVVLEFPDTPWTAENSVGLLDVIKEVKAKFDLMLIGVCISIDIESIKKTMDYNKFAEKVDFIIVNTVNYRPCASKDKQSEMVTTSLLDDIMGTVDTLVAMDMPITKMLITISVVVTSIKDGDFEDMAYDRLCTKKMDDKRKYCFDSPRNLFEKSRYSLIQSMLGIYVSNLNCGDRSGECFCKIKDGIDSFEFPPLRIIAAAFNDISTTVNSLACTLGIFPQIKDY